MTLRLLLPAAAAAFLSFAANADTPQGVDLSAIDKSVTPGDDFYRYANGSWLKRTEIPADQARWGAFNILNLEAQTRTRGLLENAAKAGAPGTEARKVGDFYRRDHEVHRQRLISEQEVSRQLQEVGFQCVSSAATARFAAP